MLYEIIVKYATETSTQSYEYMEWDGVCDASGGQVWYNYVST